MLSAIIWYLFAGVAYNFFWDLLTTRVGSQENRFTMMERLLVVLIWPLVTVFFFGMLLKNLFSNKD
jgi:hypothetical protein